MTDKILERVRLLLAKAESTTPAEAEALTEHAERLMIRHGIDQAQLAAAGPRTAEEIVTRRLEYTGTLARAAVSFGSTIAWALGDLRPLISGRDTLRRLHLVGYTADVERAELLITSLQLQARSALDAWAAERRRTDPWWRQATSADRRRWRRDFYLNFAIGAGERIAAARREAVEAAGSGAALVLTGRRQRVDRFVDTDPAVRGTSRGLQVSANGAGYMAGRSARTGEPELALPRAIGG